MSDVSRDELVTALTSVRNLVLTSCRLALAGSSSRPGAADEVVPIFEAADKELRDIIDWLRAGDRK